MMNNQTTMFASFGALIAGLVRGFHASFEKPSLEVGQEVEFRDESGRQKVGIIEKIDGNQITVCDDIGLSVVIHKSQISQDVLDGERIAERTPPRPSRF